MVVVFKILEWYITIGLVYGGYTIGKIILSEWIFVNEENKSKGEETLTQVMNRYKKISPIKIFKQIVIEDMLLWPYGIYKREFKEMLRLFKPKH